jgi:hypothetical protein
MTTTANCYDNAPRRRAPSIVRALPDGRYYQDTDGCWYLSPRADGPHARPNSNRALRFYMLRALAHRYGRTGFLFEGFRRNA